MNICKIENTICQQPFGKIANFVVNSRLRSARNIILVENKRLRSSQPRQAAERYVQPYLNHITKIKPFDIFVFRVRRLKKWKYEENIMANYIASFGEQSLIRTNKCLRQHLCWWTLAHIFNTSSYWL
jgi:hypothetical protein